MSFAFSSLLFCYHQLVCALIIAGFLFSCAKDNSKAKGRRAARDATTHHQKSVLRDERKLDGINQHPNCENPKPEPKPSLMGLFCSPKKSPILRQRYKSESNDEPKETVNTAKSNKTAIKDKNESSSSCDTCDGKADNNTNNRSKNNKSLKKVVDAKGKESDKPTEKRVKNLIPALCVVPKELYFAKDQSMAVLFIDNQSTARLGLKIQTTDCDNFKYDWVYSFLEPDSSKVLAIAYKGQAFQNAMMHLNFCMIPKGPKDAKEFFKGLDSFDERFRKIRIPLNIL